MAFCIYIWWSKVKVISWQPILVNAISQKTPEETSTFSQVVRFLWSKVEITGLRNTFLAITQHTIFTNVYWGKMMK